MFGGLHPQVRAAYARAGMLWEVHLDLLYQCDLDCEHCYLDDKSTRVLPTAFWKDVLDQLAELQVFTVHMSGGELFLRPDAFELIAHARALGLYVHIKTHGGRLDEAGAWRLAELGVSSVQLSVYSHRPEVHDLITRRPGSHERTLAALAALARADVTVLAAFVAMERNSSDLPGLAALLESMGVPLRVDGTVRVAQSGDAFPRQLSAGDEGLTPVMAFRDALAERGGGGGSGVTPAAPDPANARICSAGHLSLYVDPEGRVTPCVTWPEPLGDLAAGERLRDIWERSPRLDRIRGLRKSDLDVCSRCALTEHCDFCPGQSWLESGRPTAPSEAVCEATWARARARAQAAGQPEPPMPAGLQRPRFRIVSAAEAQSLRG